MIHQEVDDVITPAEDDYTLTPTGQLGSQIYVNGPGVQETFRTVEEALKAVLTEMERTQYWPNVWWISDHGNGWLIDPRTGQELR